MQVAIKDGNLVIATPTQTPTPSKSSAKNPTKPANLIVATSHGFQPTNQQIDGKTVYVQFNAFIRP